MLQLCRQFSIVFLALIAAQSHFAQSEVAPTGSLFLTGRVKTTPKPLTIKGTRFYLFRGGFDANKGLIDKLKSATPTSRDCFYCQIKASPQFMDWLKVGDGCDSPYCREITAEDMKVPEFKAAFDKGTTQFAKKPLLAQKWLVTNLDRKLQHGLFDQRKSMIDELLKGVGQPVQSSMTDNASALAKFLFIPLQVNDADPKATEKFVFANLVPAELGQKSYVWACEVDIGSKGPAKPPIFEAPDSSGLVKKCEVIVRDLPACSAGSCEPK